MTIPLRLSAEMTVEQGFQAIVDNCLAQIQSNQAGVVQGSDPESVHKMRVGLRRLRSAIELFGHVVFCPAALQEDLAWLTVELGAARDWEVLAGDTLAKVIRACPDEVGLAQLQQAAFEMAGESRKKTAAAVVSVRYAQLLLNLHDWGCGMPGHELLTTAEREVLLAGLDKFAAKMFARCHRKLIKRGNLFSEGTARTRHRMRIAVKKVRYTAEFFTPFYPVKRMCTYVATLTTLQDALGWLNDATVADRLLLQLANIYPDLAQDAGFVRGYLLVSTERDVRKLGKLWQKFVALKKL